MLLNYIFLVCLRVFSFSEVLNARNNWNSKLRNRGHYQIINSPDTDSSAHFPEKELFRESQAEKKNHFDLFPAQSKKERS